MNDSVVALQKGKQENEVGRGYYIHFYFCITLKKDRQDKDI